MRDQYVFDIPVYRSTSDEFDKEIDIYVTKRVEWIGSYSPQQRPLNQEMRDRQLHSVIAESGGLWQFNQVVGWLRLFVEGHTCMVGRCKTAKPKNATQAFIPYNIQ